MGYDPLILQMLANAKYRAKRDGLLFDLKPEDIVLPDKCPALGLPLRKNKGSQGDNSPTLDRVVGTYGYVKGNVQVISNRANRLKGNANAWELKQIAENTENFIKDKLMKE